MADERPGRLPSLSHDYAAGDAGEIAVDCVREGIVWFSDLGSSPLVAPVAR